MYIEALVHDRGTPGGPPARQHGEREHFQIARHDHIRSLDKMADKPELERGLYDKAGALRHLCVVTLPQTYGLDAVEIGRGLAVAHETSDSNIRSAGFEHGEAALGRRIAEIRHEINYPQRLGPSLAETLLSMRNIPR